MLIFMISWIWRRILVRRRIERETCSMLFGSRTSSWREFRKKEIGHSCARMNALVCLNHLERSLKLSTLSTKRKAKEDQLSKLSICGLISSMLRLKLETPTCSTKIMPTRNQISKILEQLRAQISAVKSWNSLQRMKSLFATSPQFHFQDLLRKTELLIMKNFMRSQK